MTMRIFGKDRCSFICAGGRTEETTWLGIASVCVYLSTHIPDAIFVPTDLQIRNKLHTTKADHHIDLEHLHGNLSAKGFEVSYAPRNFPGLSVTFELPGTKEIMTFTIFATGAFNLAGCRNSANANRAYEYILQYAQESFTDKVDPTTEATKKYDTAMKNIVTGQRRKPGANSSARVCLIDLFESQKAKYFATAQSPAVIGSTRKARGRTKKYNGPSTPRPLDPDF